MRSWATLLTIDPSTIDISQECDKTCADGLGEEYPAHRWEPERAIS